MPPVVIPKDDLSPRATANLVAIGTSDVNGNFIVTPTRAGTTLKGHPTAGFCGQGVSSDGHRLARREVSLATTDNKEAGLYNEVVVYDSEAAAALAVRQLEADLKGCPKRPQVTGKAKIRRHASLPVADNAIVSSVLTSHGESFHVLVIWQRKGVVLSIVKAGSAHRIPAWATRAVTEFATIGGAKLVTV